MKFYFFAAWTVLTICSCSQQPEETSKEKANEQFSIEDVSTTEETPLDSLTIDWPSIKNEFRFLNCGANDSERNYFTTPKKGTFTYEYCAHNANQKTE